MSDPICTRCQHPRSQHQYGWTGECCLECFCVKFTDAPPDPPKHRTRFYLEGNPASLSVPFATGWENTSSAERLEMSAEDEPVEDGLENPWIEMVGGLVGSVTLSDRPIFDDMPPPWQRVWMPYTTYEGDRITVQTIYSVWDKTGMKQGFGGTIYWVLRQTPPIALLAPPPS